MGGASYTYDNAGNMNYDGDGLMYGYDPENRLTTVDKIEGALASACEARLAWNTRGASP